ncbi:MAG: hypothetical protein KGH63_03790, partial [Candidatus Micrarchaeota archaeon]|nr:hypothetical protein [Candidatus Micrarchaeota archaeon]
MARCTIQPGAALQGSVRPPPSYAHAIRLVWGACLGAGGTIGNCPDRPAIRALLALGSAIGAEPEFEN